MPQPWERQADETDQAYAAFLAYRDIGSRRTVHAAYQKTRGHSTGTKQAPGRWKKWSSSHAWIARAIAWDRRSQHVADLARERTITGDVVAKTRRDIRDARKIQVEDDEWDLRALLVEEGRRILKSPNYRQKVNSKSGQIELVPANWNKRTGVEMLSLAMKLGRASAQMPLVASETEPRGFDDAMYETSGQLSSELPAGSVPTMPVDTFARPNLEASVADAGELPKPDARNRERP